MTKPLIISIMFICFGANANEIQGTLMLKGTLKTSIIVNGIKTVCRLKVNKVKNLLVEDSFGNPAYQAQIQISLDGRDFEKNIKVKMEKDLTVTNLHQENNVRLVKDLHYTSAEGEVSVSIDPEGRLVSTSFPFNRQAIQCNF